MSGGDGGKRRRPGAAAVWAATILLGCGGGSGIPSSDVTPPCRLGPVASLAVDGALPAGPGSAPKVRWTRPADPEDRAELDRLCGEVGPPLVIRAARPGGEAGTDELVVVAWNVHMDGGQVSSLVQDLRAGRLTGRPVGHFVLLLQEAVRVESGASPRSTDLAGLARRERMDLLYVPSIPERWAAAGPTADRGNAILSTLPIGDPEALELPVQRRRRVAVAATVQGIAADGSPSEIRMVSVHLENRSRWRALHRSLGEDRAWQAARLVQALEAEEVVVVGGDFNTWFGARKEPAARLLEAHFPPSCPPPESGTIDIPLMTDMTLDHVFFRLPAAWWASYEVLPHAYGSDHRPLMARVRFEGPARCP